MLKNPKTLIISNIISIFAALINNKNKNKKIKELEKELKILKEGNNKTLKNDNQLEEKLKTALNENKDKDQKIEVLNQKLNEKFENNTKQIIANDEFQNDQLNKIVTTDLNDQNEQIQNKRKKRQNKKILKTEISQKIFNTENNQNEYYLENEKLRQRNDYLENQMAEMENYYNLNYKEFINKYENKEYVINEQEKIIQNQNEKINGMVNFIKNVEDDLKDIKAKNDQILKKEINENPNNDLMLDNFIRDLEKKNQNSIAHSQVLRDKIKKDLRYEMKKNKQNKIDGIISSIDNFLNQYGNK